jgi:hypothetical protein
MRALQFIAPAPVAGNPMPRTTANPQIPGLKLDRLQNRFQLGLLYFRRFNREIQMFLQIRSANFIK